MIFTGGMRFAGGITFQIPAGSSGLSGIQKTIFGYGYSSGGSLVSLTNIASSTGTVGNDVTGVGTARMSLAAAGYGGDKAIFGYGGYQSMTNKVSNTGVIATDTTGVGTARNFIAAAGFSLTA